MDVSAIGQIEQAIFLLRRLDARTWLLYLIGAIPLLLTLLTFVHDMSVGTLSNRCALESLLCTLAFFWASAWKAKFAGTLLAQIDVPGSAPPPTGFLRALYLQSILQTLKLIALPFAIVSVLPLAWVFSFFRNATIEAGLPAGTLGSVITKSASRAGANTRSLWLGLFILFVIALLTFINVYALVSFLPFLIRLFSGIETEFTRSIGRFFTFNVFCVVAAITWLLVDPLLLAYAVIRCFYLEARKDGRDILAQLRAAAILTLLCLAILPLRAVSAETIHAPTFSKEKLSGALQEASQSDDYSWLRMQKVKENDDGSFLASLSRDINDLFHKVGAWVSAVENWFRRLLQRDPLTQSDETPDTKPVSAEIRWLLYGLAALVLIAAVVVLWRSRIAAEEPTILSSFASPTPDLNKENLLATELAEEEWLRMARELLGQGELRLAIRAMYLSNLSYLGSQQFIRIARSKTNAMYERELRLRPHGSNLSAPFIQSNRSFERAWYGFHDVTPESVNLFQRDVEAIRQHAKV